MHRYEIILYWSNEDHAFIAEAPELPGCMAHGDNQEEALKNIKDAKHSWIEVCLERGNEVPLPSTENTFVSSISLRKEMAV